MSDQSLKKRRILLVDDEPELRRMVAAMLAAEGFSHVVQAANVQEALAAHRQAKPELALLDVMLPDGDGFTLCQYLRPCPSSSSRRKTKRTTVSPGCAAAPTTT